MDETKNTNHDVGEENSPTQPVEPAIPERFKQSSKTGKEIDPKDILLHKEGEDQKPEPKKKAETPDSATGISYEVDPTTKEPDPEPLKQTPRSVGQLPRIRTYAADMSSAIKQRGETLAGIVNRESVSRKKPEISEAEKTAQMRKRLIGGGAIALALVGIFAVGGALFFSQKDEPVVVPEQGIIFANDTAEVILQPNSDLEDELAHLRRNRNLSLGEVLRVEVIENGARITGSDLALRLGIPSALARDITGMMLGIHSFDRNQPFMIFEVLAYDRAFGAMLSWERDIARDLGDVYKPTHATTSAPLLSFEDKIIRNLDTRISQDAWPILYTFPERKMLIVTTNEFTLQEILTRLQSSLR